MTPSDPILLGLPHRAPFVFLDRVTSISAGENGCAEKSFAADDPIFGGHFPGDPIVPGVLLTEAIAQLSGIVAASQNEEVRYYLSAIRGMKFPSPAKPEELIQIEVQHSGGLGGLLYFEGSAKVGGRLVAQGSIILSEAS